MTRFRQLDIYWVDLEPAKDSETKKLRPCVILQGDWVNVHSRTLIIAPLLPHHKSWPFAVNLKPSKQNGLDKDRHINLKQLRVVDISCIRKKQGKVETAYFKAIKTAVTMVFNLSQC